MQKQFQDSRDSRSLSITSAHEQKLVNAVHHILGTPLTHVMAQGRYEDSKNDVASLVCSRYNFMITSDF